MAKQLRIDAYVCNDCGFRFLGSTDQAVNRRLAATKRSRTVMCPKCSGPCRVDKYAAVRTTLLCLVVCTVAAAAALWVMRWVGWL